MTRILGSTDAAASNVLYRLKRKDRVQEIEKGTYLLVPARAGPEGAWTEAPLLLVPHLIDTYYVGFWTALNHWGLTEQVPRTVFVATTKRKRDVTFGPTTFQFVTLSDRKFFGATEAQIAQGTFLISDLEKTLVDCLGLPAYAGGLGEVVKGLWNARDDLDADRLADHADRYGVKVLRRRLSYLLDVLDIAPDTRDHLVEEDPTGYMWLDPQGPKEVLAYDKTYGLKVNRTEDELLGWRGT